jgi:threonyl-tRNA synthetase
MLYDELVAAGLRPRLEVDGSLGARIRASRGRRDCLIAVLGAAEVESGSVQVIDVAAGFSGPVDRADLVPQLRRAHKSRCQTVCRDLRGGSDVPGERPSGPS